MANPSLDYTDDAITEWVRAFLNERYYKVSYRTDMIFEIANFARDKLKKEEAKRTSY